MFVASFRVQAIAKRAQRFLPGVPEIFDGGLQNLPGVPGPRQVRYYSATPYPLKDIVRVSALMVDAALEALGGPKGRVLGVTFDCVHGESRLEVVRDIDGEYVVLGPASPDGLKGAARGKDDFDDDKALGGKDIAKKLMTVVLQVFNGEHVDREVCIAVVPLNEETGKGPTDSLRHPPDAAARHCSDRERRGDALGAGRPYLLARRRRVAHR